MSENKVCLNCDNLMNGPICSQCGQKAALPFETKRVAKDIWSHFLELDFKFIRAIRDSITRPGYMIKEYLIGKRISYSNPFKLLFFVATGYYLVIQYFEISVGSFSAEAEEAGKMVSVLLNYLIFLFLIPTAFFFKWIYARKTMNFAESYVSLCFIWSGYLLLGIPTAFVISYTDLEYNIVRSGIGIVYIIYTSLQLFEIKFYTGLWKGILFFACYILSTFLVMSVVIAISYLIGFEPLMIGA